MRGERTTRLLRRLQRRRAAVEQQAADAALDRHDAEDAGTHARRAERAAYLDEKLAERERSEVEATADGEPT